MPLYPSNDYKVYTDDNFVSGDSPVTLDVRTDLSHDANNGYIVCNGPGSILVAFAKGSNGTTDDSITLGANDVLDIMGEGISKIIITHSGVNSSYEVFVE
jgi:hypothetical protein